MAECIVFRTFTEYADTFFDVSIYFIGDIKTIQHARHKPPLDRRLLYAKAALCVETEKSTAFFKTDRGVKISAC